MKVVIPNWHGRVSPLFDVAERFMFVDIEKGTEVKRSEWIFSSGRPAERVDCVVQSGAGVVICGAISDPLRFLLRSSGVRVIPNMCGYVDHIIKAYENGTLLGGDFYMPGCGRPGRRRRARNRGGR